MTIAEKLLRAKADIDEVYEAGKKSQYDEFWDSYQNNGARNYYILAFGGEGWNDKTFRPKYNIAVQSDSFQMFRSTAITDLVAALNRAGVTLDFSKATSFTQVFHSAALTRIGTIDTTNAPSVTFTQLFFNCQKLITIEKLILSNNGTQKYSQTFQGCDALVNLTIEGVIGQTGVSFQQSKSLSKASITSIINALSTTTSGLSITFSKTAVNNAFPDTSGWNALIGTRSNWTINLV